MNMENILGKPSVSFLAILIEPGIGLACKTMVIFFLIQYRQWATD